MHVLFEEFRGGAFYTQCLLFILLHDRGVAFNIGKHNSGKLTGLRHEKSLKQKDKKKQNKLLLLGMRPKKPHQTMMQLLSDTECTHWLFTISCLNERPSPLSRAWWTVHTWLQDFLFRNSASWWIFLMSGIGMIVIALIGNLYYPIFCIIATDSKATEL